MQSPDFENTSLSGFSTSTGTFDRLEHVQQAQSARSQALTFVAIARHLHTDKMCAPTNVAHKCFSSFCCVTCISRRFGRKPQDNAAGRQPQLLHVGSLPAIVLAPWAYTLRCMLFRLADDRTLPWGRTTSS